MASGTSPEELATEAAELERLHLGRAMHACDSLCALQGIIVDLVQAEHQ